ncbi:MAG: DMT family transporter [Saezia sp.]
MPPVLLSYLCLAASMSLVGTYVGLSKSLVSVFPVLLVIWLRYSIAIAPMLTWLKRRPEEAPMSLQNGALISLSSFIGSFLFTLCTLTGIKMSSALSAGIIMAGIPAAVALLSFIFLKERIALKTYLAIICAVSGIALLAFANTTAASENTSAHENPQWQALIGHLLLIIGVFCEAAYVVIGKKISAQVSPQRISAYMNLWGWIFSMPFGLYLILQFDFTPVHWQHWALLVFYSFAAGIFSVWLWMTGLKNIPASSAGIFTMMLPIATTTVGVLMGEHFTLMHGLALMLALFGLVLATWPKKGFLHKQKHH